MAELFQGLRWIHIAVGSLALVAFWIPASAKKGGRVHVNAGWFYVICMAIVVATAFILSGMAFGWPLRVRNFERALSAEEAARIIRNSRMFAFFLSYLAGLTLAAGWQGVRVLQTRQEPGKFRTPFTLALNVAVVLAALGCLVMGLLRRNGVFLVMSPIGFLVSGGNLAYLLRGPQSKMHWWYEHLGSMIGTGIAGYTAFLVFGAGRLFPGIARTPFHALVWILPTLIGVPAIFLTVSYYRRKFHEDGRAPKQPDTQMNPAV
ncbi:MAG: hypothetical protein WB780_17755 [Candidatus Acidiferrales bacterium]